MTIRPETVDLVDFLNHLVRVDAPAMQALMEARVPCSTRLGEHPTVQVAPTRSGPEGLVFGVLGLINGYCGTIGDGPKAGWGPIAAHYYASDARFVGDLVHFTVLPEAIAEIAMQRERKSQPTTEATMTAYLMIGGPVHGHVKEVLHGEQVLVPDYNSSIETAIATGAPLKPPTRMAAYNVWKIPTDLLPDAPALNLMKLDGMVDGVAMGELSAMLRPRLDAMYERTVQERGPASIDKFRAFLDQVDQHYPRRRAAWRTYTI